MNNYQLMQQNKLEASQRPAKENTAKENILNSLTRLTTGRHSNMTGIESFILQR